jgi:hypothetical protein
LATPFCNVKGLARGFLFGRIRGRRRIVAAHNLNIEEDREFFPFQENFDAASQHRSSNAGLHSGLPLSRDQNAM